MRSNSEFCCHLSAFFLLVWLIPLLAMAQDETWRERRDRLQAEVDVQIQAKVEREVRPEAVALANDLSWPVPPASKTLDKVFAEVEASLKDAVEQEFPTRMLDEIQKQIENEHGYCKIGDKVSVQTIGKMGYVITGHLQAVTPGRLRIGNHWVTAVDLDKDTMARFFPEQAGPVMKKYLDRELRLHQMRINEFKRQFRRQHLPVQLRQNGYVPLEMLHGPDFLSPANWISQEEWFTECLFAERQAYLDKIASQVKEAVFSEHGFYYDAEAREWRPVELRSRKNEGLLGKLKRLFR